jgi:SHS2 domain-containing protein
MSFVEIPHTADVKIRIHSQTLEGLFSDACRALMTVMYGNLRSGFIKKEIIITSSDIDSLLLDFLSEILFVSDCWKGLFFSKGSCSYLMD